MTESKDSTALETALELLDLHRQGKLTDEELDGALKQHQSEHPITEQQ